MCHVLFVSKGNFFTFVNCTGKLIVALRRMQAFLIVMSTLHSGCIDMNIKCEGQSNRPVLSISTSILLFLLIGEYMYSNE